jgi:hypothetical protein
LETDDETASKRMQLLKERHSQLHDECDRLSKIVGLGAAEHKHLRNLKVLKLKCRDAMSELRREYESVWPAPQPENDPLNW